MEDFFQNALEFSKLSGNEVVNNTLQSIEKHAEN